MRTRSCSYGRGGARFIWLRRGWGGREKGKECELVEGFRVLESTETGHFGGARA
jgi:hypothetical protein